ncbi:MAG: hypothetical protein ACLRFE_01810, partial [Clostridia bacterium]
MSKGKKIFLILGILAVLIAGVVVGWFFLKRDDKPKEPKIKPSEIVIPDLLESMKYEFDVGELTVQKGGNTINYSYNPNSEVGAIAYEYQFVNTTDNEEYAINVDDLICHGTDVKYAWSINSPIDAENEKISAYGDVVGQVLSNKVDKLYMYIIVMPQNSAERLEVTLTPAWRKGNPKQINVIDNVTNQIQVTQTVVDGQPINVNTFITPVTPEGYYFDAWFKDDCYTQLLTSTSRYGDNVYIRYANLPAEYLVYDDVSGSYMVKQNDGGNFLYGGALETNPIKNIVVPTVYKAQGHPQGNVTRIQSAGWDSELRINYYESIFSIF